MAKKYIYSEEKVLKEFVSSLLSKMIVDRNSKILQNLIKTDPIIAKYDKEIVQLGKEISQDIQRKRKKDPDYDRRYKELGKIFK